MTANLVDYLLWRGDLPLTSHPLNEVDCAILSALSYFPFERILQETQSRTMTIRDAARTLIESLEEKKDPLAEEDARFLRALAESVRFSEALLSGFVYRLEEESQTQFSAVTIDLGEEALCVAYRGPDATLIGWKEDFNMGVMCPVPSQALSVDYLNRTGGSCARPLVVCGHSKGGNLAVYASAFCREDIQRRIRSIYNFDGPGFSEDVLAAPGYARIRERIRSFVPQFSIVGMLFGNGGSCLIVHSEQLGILQHDLFSWSVERDRFCYLESVNSGSRFVDGTLKSWISSLNREQREQFIEAIYSVLKETQARTVKELADNWFTSVRRALRSLKNLDEPTRRAVVQTLLLLIKSTRAGFNQAVQAAPALSAEKAPSLPSPDDKNDFSFRS